MTITVLKAGKPEAERAEDKEHESAENEMAWVAARHFSEAKRKLFKHCKLVIDDL